MKRYPTQIINLLGIPILCLMGLPENAIDAHAQETHSGGGEGYGSAIIVTGGLFTATLPNGVVGDTMSRTGPGGSGAAFVVQTRSGSCSDLGAVLLKACDLNHDGNATLPELQAAASACFKLWDTNNTGGLDQTALLNGIKDLLPMPQLPAGMTPPPDEFAPPYQLSKHILAAVDSNKDGVITLQELNDCLEKNFSQWDQDHDGRLTAQELGLAFAQLAAPEPSKLRILR
jgi:Ca2+-binding EF-hand superfamily protein